MNEVLSKELSGLFEKKTTLRGETFARRNFRVFAIFSHFRETKSPRKGLTLRFAKVYPTRKAFYEKEGP